MAKKSGEKLFVGVDVGGTTFKLVVGDAQGKVLAERKSPTQSQRGPAGVLAHMAKEIQAALREAGGARAEGVGVGFPGTLDIPNGMVKFLANFPGHWLDVPARDILSKDLGGTPVYLFNDARCATLGEYDYGKGRTAKTMIYLGLGTGIGGGVVIDGKLRLGPIGSAGELGHFVVEPRGRSCGCGGHGCIETYATGPALSGEGVRLLLSGQAPKLHDIVGGDPSKVDPRTMGEAARAGDAKVREAIERAAWFLGVVVANLTVTLHPDLFVIGGGVANLGDMLFDKVRESLLENVRMFPVDNVRIEPMDLGERAGVMGALALAIRGGNVG